MTPDAAVSLRHIAVDLLGNRRDIGIPRPVGVIGMAILTGALQDLANLHGNVGALQGGFPYLRLLSGALRIPNC